MIIGIAVVFTVLFVLSLARLTWIVRAARRSGAPDIPAALLAVACHDLPEDRVGWGAAMAAELDSVRGRAARWRFALGGARAATVVRLAGRLAGQPILATVWIGAAVCEGLAVAAVIRYPGLHAEPKITLFAVVLTVVLAAYILLATARARDSSAAAESARRFGLATGIVLALVWFVFAAAWWNLHGVPMLVGLVIPVIAGAVSARSTIWAALVAGLAVFIAMTADAFATAGRPSALAAHWMGEDLGAALLLLIFIPALTIAFGMVGRLVGMMIRPRSRRAEGRQA